MFSIEPKPTDDQDVVRQLCEEVRARVPGAEVRLLSTVAIGLSWIGVSYNVSPGELVSALWDAVHNDASDLVQFRGSIRTQIRNLIRSERSRSQREIEFIELYLDDELVVDDALPSWLWQLNLTERELRIWIGYSVLDETDREIAAALGICTRKAKTLRTGLFAKLEKSLVQMFR